MDSTSSSPSSSQYKGVAVPRWGAPIYEGERQHHHREEREWLCSSASKNEVKEELEEEEEEEEDNYNGGNRDGEGGVIEMEKEHMFDKVVTPSDVGKLNRLVIPKQHAEKYFPLDCSSNEKGLLLNFEDRTGKPWRFRYSYWNSSQSYVMTKGWSRFVKEKKLDAGDIVSFQRGLILGDQHQANHKLFIDWRRRFRLDAPLLPHHQPPIHHTFSIPGPPPVFSYVHRSVPAAGAAWTPTTPASTFLFRSSPTPSPLPTTNMVSSYLHPYPQSYPHPQGRGTISYSSPPTIAVGDYGGACNAANPFAMATGPLILLRSSEGMVQVHGEEDDGAEPMVYESVPVVQGKAAAKRLRLFGVNMDCPISHRPHDYDVLSLASTSTSSSTPYLDHHHHHRNRHHHHHLPEHNQHQRQRQCQRQQSYASAAALEMGPSPSSSLFSAYQHSISLELGLQSSSSVLPNLVEKGKSSSSSSMSLEKDI